ncbi:von Willebrand factor [Rubritalea squalenifaciens DSM 18772]|uniref:von Willebrand factor n=1 Tax=Rubritalea squalenifaciens DSM 18772 TaxID=1123071 RepID=A0A1M6II77_9BACT|nr:von Willebrand factor type A domain-containing protein [Rubritalea squalenifaciens]SHJ34104.1 von Willebrand factor [Rubritalea squalenifaciens DSM 18772]
MKIDENDPRLTAYAFGELPQKEAEAVRLAIKSKPELRKYVNELVALNDLLASGFGSNDSLKLHPDQRAAIHQAGKVPVADNITSMRQSAWKRPLTVILSAAAVLTACFVILNNALIHDDNMDLVDVQTIEDIPASDLVARVSENPSDWTENEQSKPAEVTSSQPSSEGEAMTVARGMELQPREFRDEIQKRATDRVRHSDGDENLEKPNEWRMVSNDPSTRVPLVSGNASWKWVTQALQAGLRPISQDVRVEELINHFSYDQPKDFIIGGIDAGAELLHSPWDEGKLIALVNLRNNSDEEPMVEVGLTFGHQINAYRLLGYNQTSAAKGVIAPTMIKMQSGYGQMVMYEVDPGMELEEGHKALLVHVNASGVEDADHRSFGVEYAKRDWRNASKDVRLALTMAAWAQCLKFNIPDDREVTLELLDSLKEDELDEETQKSLNVIRNSLQK